MHLTKVVDGCSEVVRCCVDAPHHNLVLEHQTANQLGSRQLNRTIAKRYTGQHIRAIYGKSVNKIKRQQRNPCGFEDNAAWADLPAQFVGCDVATVDVAAADSHQPLRAYGTFIYDVQSDDFSPTQPQHQRGEQAYRPEPRHQTSTAEQPVGSSRCVGQTRHLQLDRFRDGFFRD